MNVTQTDAIKRFLTQKTHSDLAAMYNASMEVQVIVAVDGGRRVDSMYNGHKYTTYTDDIQVWKPFRIPRNAKTTPEYNLDTSMDFDLTKHVEGIGMTGWDWQGRVSRWVAFDFDAMVGHSDLHSKKLSEAELDAVREAASSIPWITVRKSTGGSGLHLYVMLDAVPTANHTEHAALARSILGVMTAMTGFDFQSGVDICGSNMWVWHRKMAGTDGLTVIKQGSVLTEIPANWQDHMCVVSGRKKRSIPAFISDKQSEVIEKLYEELSGQRNKIPLDADHKRLIEYLAENNCYWTYDQDNSMLVAHTYDLKQAHEALELKGVFQTIAQGTEQGADKNCFLYPMRNGAWAVRRFSPGVAEAPTWEQDGQGWTRCFLNTECDLKTAARCFGGREDTDGSFHFRETEMAAKTMQMIGVHVDYTPSLRGHAAKLKEAKDGKIIFSIEHKADDTLDMRMESWLKKKGWLQNLYRPKAPPRMEQEVGNYDEVVRHLVTAHNENFGWCLYDDKGWRKEPLEHVKIYLNSLGLNSTELQTALGSCISKYWKVVNKPFQPEYPGDREWNKDGAQLKYLPSQNEILKFPNWIKVLEHCGKGLNSAVANDKWCQANGILTGADYLKVWIAALVQKPTEPLPYLFFYSFAQDTGKSIFHEGISLLMTKGVERADSSLTNQQGFNAEIEHAVLCVVEETNLQSNKVAYNRIKDWVTARHLPIHRKRETPYTVINTTHWVQCANDPTYCPIFSGDTRITMIRVDPFEDVTEMIPKHTLLELLQKEAPDFIAELMNLELPKPNGRLSIPVVETTEKIEAAKANRSMLEEFLSDNVFPYEGNMVDYGELYEKFRSWLDPNEIHKWSKIRFGKEIVRFHPKGRDPKTSQFAIGNISLKKKGPDDPNLPRLVSDGERLVPYDH